MKVFMRWAVVFTVFFFVGLNGYAEETHRSLADIKNWTPSSTAHIKDLHHSTEAASQSGGSWISVICQMILFFGGAFALVWIFRRLPKKKAGEHTIIRIVEKQKMGSQWIWVVDIAGDYLVIGSGSKGLQCLHHIQHPDAINRVQEKAEAHADKPFHHILNQQKALFKSTQK